MRTKCLPIVLPPSVYTRLERAARAEERDPLQQARWILKRALNAPEETRPDSRLATATPGPGEAAAL
jgi:hypothetical protein